LRASPNFCVARQTVGTLSFLPASFSGAAANSPSVRSGDLRMASRNVARSASSSLRVSGRLGGLGSSVPRSRRFWMRRRTNASQQPIRSATSDDEPYSSYALATALRNSIE